MKRLSVAASTTLLLVTAVPATAQQKSGIIRGRVIAADTNRPLRRARITLISTSAGIRPVIGPSTNSQGQFELKDVAPGTYYVSASRAGYIDLQHGQRRPGERGLAIGVKDGQTVERVDIALPRGSVITGRVTDELGEPYPGLRVYAFALRYQQGRRIPFFPSAGASVGAVTDDLGDYRLASLQPGSYYVVASSPEMWRNEKKETMAYATTYYPGAASNVPQAVTVDVAQERAGIDFSLTASKAARVTGRVLNSSGQPMAAEPVSLVLSVRGAIGTMPPISSRTQADGAFEFRDVPPAEYTLRAGSRGESASVLLPVSGDVENIVLVTRSGSTVTGSVVTDEGVGPPFPASGVRLNLIAPTANVLPTVRVPAVNNDWTFRLTSLGGGFLFRTVGLPDGWMLDAVKLNDVEITDTAWDVPTGGREIGGLQVVITRQVGKIGGSVTTFDGKPSSDATVVVFAEDARLWIPGSRFIRMTRPNSDGQFSITGLPAGAYLAVAKDFVQEGQWEDKEFLEAARSDGVRVTLARGESANVALKLTPRR